MWLDRWERTIQIDWQAERFKYLCANPERPAAFTPGMLYPLQLLVETDLSPAVSSVPLLCAACQTTRVPDQAAMPCPICGCRDSMTRGVPDVTPAPVAETKPAPKRRQQDDGLKQLSLF
jgi:hypothetical protein